MERPQLTPHEIMRIKEKVGEDTSQYQKYYNVVKNTEQHVGCSGIGCDKCPFHYIACNQWEAQFEFVKEMLGLNTYVEMEYI